jgi:hypothetical protein
VSTESVNGANLTKLHFEEDTVRKMGAEKSGMLGWVEFRGLEKKSGRHKECYLHT